MKNNFYSNRLIRKTLSFVAMIAMVGMVGTSQASADEYGRIDREARRIERKTKQLLKETNHYKNTANYEAMVNSCLQLKSFATHVHDVSHFEGNLAHLKNDIGQLDNYLHIAEDLFDQTEHNASLGYGCVKGNTRHVKRLIESIDKSICKMQKDLASICRRVEVPAVVYRPVIVKQTAPPVVVQPRVVVAPRAYEVDRYEYRVPNFDRFAPRSFRFDHYDSDCPSMRYR